MVDGPTWDGIDGLNETISIGREAGIRVVGSHVKAKGRSSWGRSYMDTMLIDLARAEGVQVYLDHYPYETNNGGAQTVFPAWALEGGPEALRDRLADPQVRDTLVTDLVHMIDQSGGPGRLIITNSIDETMIGKSIHQVARERGMEQTDLMIELALQGSGRNRAGIRIRPLSMHEYDNDQYIRQDYTATSTDGGVDVEPGGPPGPHPRYWGAFPRKIARYVKQRGVITLPFAIRSMTGLGAQIIGLPDRGYLREGYKADVVVFSLDEITDNATIMEPGLPSTGIYWVLVNGEPVMADTELTGALAGRVLIRGQ
jgi:N-acyl-D-aspartate/D-glutamate deacylase